MIKQCVGCKKLLWPWTRKYPRSGPNAKKICAVCYNQVKTFRSDGTYR